MYVIIVNGSSDKYSHTWENMLTHGSIGTEENPYMHFVTDYLARFRKGQYSCIQIMVQRINDDTGMVEVLVNERGLNPLQKRIEINVKAKEAQKARRPGRISPLADFMANHAQVYNPEPALEEEDD